MIKKKAFVLIGFLAIVVVSLSFWLNLSTSKAQEGIPQTQEAKKIQDVIRRSYELEALAGRTFDISEFHTVFINDPRGKQLSPSTLDFITSVSSDVKKPSYGYLDYKIAYYAWWKAGALKFEKLKSNADKANRALSKQEIKSLVDDKGRMALPRLQGDYIPTPLVFSSIDIENDLAVVIFDDGLRTNQMTLVLKNDKWYIAGNTILSVHP